MSAGERRLRVIGLAALTILYAGWIAYVIVRDTPVDFYLYYVAAHGFAAGEDIYAVGESGSMAPAATWERLAAAAHVTQYAPPYRYPPLTAMLVWPLTVLSPRAAAAIWLIASAGAFIRAAWLIGESGALRWGVVLALTMLLFFVPPLATLHAGQVNAFVLLALAYGINAVERKRFGAAGGAAGVGALLKLMPLAHVAYFGWRGQRRAVIAGLLVIGGGLLFSVPLVGGHGLASYADHFIALGEPGKLFPVGANQSFNGFFARWLPEQARWLWWVASMGLMGATAVLCARKEQTGRLCRLEFSLVTAAISLITPYVWYHQLALLFIPFFVLVEQIAKEPPLRWLLLPLSTAYVLTDVHGLAWHRLEGSGMPLSMPFGTTILLWGMLAWFIGREKWPTARRTVPPHGQR